MSSPSIKRVTFDEAPPMVVELPLYMPPDLEIDPSDTSYQDIVLRMTGVFYQIQTQEALKAITVPKRGALVTVLDGILADIGAKESTHSPIPLCWKIAKIVTCFLGIELCQRHDYRYPGKCGDIIIAEKMTMPKPEDGSVWWGDISYRWCEFFISTPAHRKRTPHDPS